MSLALDAAHQARVSVEEVVDTAALEQDLARAEPAVLDIDFDATHRELYQRLAAAYATLEKHVAPFGRDARERQRLATLRFLTFALGVAALVGAGVYRARRKPPLDVQASASFDKIVHKGKTVGASMFAGYSYNERSMLSLGICDPDIAIGTEVTLVWGEPNGGSQKATVERHKQLEIRATVSPVPYAAVVRDTYAEGWRSTGKA